MDGERTDDEFARLFREVYPSLVREMYLLLGSWQAAEDTAQDAFVRLLRRWPKISLYDRPGAWVRRVALHLALDTRRTWFRRRRLLRSLKTEPTTLEPPDPGILQVLDDLPGRQRAAVVLHYFGGYPVAEVANLLGCKEGTAKVHLHRARERLRDLLDEETDDVAR